MENLNLTTEEAIVAGGVAGGMLATAGIATLVFYIFTVIAGWKIFEKAGEKGWKSLIPIYNFYLLYKIAGLKNWFWITLLASFIGNFALGLAGVKSDMTEEEIKALDLSAHIPALCVFVVAAIVMLVADIKQSVNLAKSFGKGTGFAVALIFFPNICWLILGFGSAKYDKKFVKSLEK